MDRIEYINKLLAQQEFKSSKKQSIIVNNFFSLVTIILVSIVIILYVNYFLPTQNLKKEKPLNIREQQIALSHKLNQLP
jgi:hypothetical protein